MAQRHYRDELMATNCALESIFDNHAQQHVPVSYCKGHRIIEGACVFQPINQDRNRAITLNQPITNPATVGGAIYAKNISLRFSSRFRMRFRICFVTPMNNKEIIDKQPAMIPMMKPVTFWELSYCHTKDI
jgi:hypothetical protein